MMLMPPKKGRGRRKTDRPYLQQVKGVLAGIVQVLENSGKSQADAAAWVARNIPKALETKLAPKTGHKAEQITPSSILEWKSRYSGAGGQRSLAREGFLTIDSPPAHS